MNTIAKATPSIKGKLNNFWDPLYDPTDDEIYPDNSWDFSNTTGIKHSTCNSLNLKAVVNGRPTHLIKKLTFERCNFRGDFNEIKLTFSDCIFELCDFGYAKWHKVKFHGCTFKKCSLTMLTFYQCQFIDCTWEEIGLSGNETLIYKSSISNPQEFIQSAYTCLNEDILRQKNTSPSYQQMRLEQTKAKLARIVLTNLERHGDDESYYKGVKTYLNQSIVARIAEAKHNLFSKKKIIINTLLISANWLEYVILNISGKINAWGYSIGRPTIIGVSIITVFGCLYYLVGISKSITVGIMTGFDVTLLFGYTKQVTNTMDGWKQVLFAFNAFLGLWWYAVFVPTIINRISRVRG